MLTPHFNDTHIPITLLVALAYLWIREHQRCGDTSQISKTPSRQGLSSTTRFCAQPKTTTSNSHHFVSLSLSLSTSAVLTLSLSLSLSTFGQSKFTVNCGSAHRLRSSGSRSQKQTGGGPRPPDPLGSRARQLLNLNPGLTFATAAAAVRAIALLGWRSCRGTSEPSAQLRCHCMAPHAPPTPTTSYNTSTTISTGNSWSTVFRH